MSPLLILSATALWTNPPFSQVETYASQHPTELRALLEKPPGGLSGARLSAALQAVAAVRTASLRLTLMKYVAVLREDSDFQSDLQDPRVIAAMQEIKATNDQERWALGGGLGGPGSGVGAGTARGVSLVPVCGTYATHGCTPGTRLQQGQRAIPGRRRAQKPSC